MRSISRALIVAGLLASPFAAQAQTTSAWQLCFTGGVLSCTDFTLTTTPQMAGSVRSGTLFDIALRYTETTSWLSALQSVSVTFATLASDAQRDGPPALIDFSATGGANGSGQSQRWVAYAGSSPTDPWANALVLSSNPGIYGLFGDPTTSWMIGGCGVGAQSGVIDIYFPTPLWTCGSSASYMASFFSAATLDADRVTSIGVDAYRAYPGDGPLLAPFCVAQTDNSGSIGTATGDFTDYGDVCSVRDLSVTATPEPAATLLIAAGLALLLPIVRLTGASTWRTHS